MFVTATGGPGSSGLAVADSYTSVFDPSIPEHFDIVFFDQRGVTASGGLQCADAAAAFYQSDWRGDTPEREAALTDTARTFAADCVQEMGSPPMLPYLGTRQAVEDLERFRQAIGDEQFWLYGESYGTQYAQTYAAAYPEHLAGLILDGTVDLTLDLIEYYRQQTQAFNDVVEATLDACTADEACRADVGGDALEFYDEMAAELAVSPITFTFPLPSGGSAEREFTLSDLETVAVGYVYSEADRMVFQRALAGAARGEITPLARLLYLYLVLDAETLEPIPDPSYSDAMYYSVECQDYSDFEGTPEERAEAYLRAGDAVETAVPRFSSIFYGDLPCAFWPDTPDRLDRPAPLTASGITTFVLGATADPATPVSNGKQVYSRVDDGYLITTEGGPHVIFGRGNACPDEIITAFLVEDARPSERELSCEGEIASPYVALAPADAAEFADPLEAMQSADNEIYYLPEYYYWDVTTPTTAGCPYGGTLAFEPSDSGEAFTLTDCAFSDGFVMTGSGVYDYEQDLFTLDVTISGIAEGALVYERDGNGEVSVTGDYGGQSVGEGDS
jgi:pimeloyl-ACP methyl ester carboxylesterase